MLMAGDWKQRMRDFRKNCLIKWVIFVRQQTAVTDVEQFFKKKPADLLKMVSPDSPMPDELECLKFLLCGSPRLQHMLPIV